MISGTLEMKQADELYCIVESTNQRSFIYYYRTLDEANKIAEADWNRLIRKRMNDGCSIVVYCVHRRDVIPALLDKCNPDEWWRAALIFDEPDDGFNSDYVNEYEQLCELL